VTGTASKSHIGSPRAGNTITSEWPQHRSIWSISGGLEINRSFNGSIHAIQKYRDIRDNPVKLEPKRSWLMNRAVVSPGTDASIPSCGKLSGVLYLLPLISLSIIPSLQGPSHKNNSVTANKQVSYCTVDPDPFPTAAVALSVGAIEASPDFLQKHRLTAVFESLNEAPSKLHLLNTAVALLPLFCSTLLAHCTFLLISTVQNTFSPLQSQSSTVSTTF